MRSPGISIRVDSQEEDLDYDLQKKNHNSLGSRELNLPEGEVMAM